MSVSNAFIDARRHRVLGRLPHKSPAKWGHRGISQKAPPSRGGELPAQRARLDRAARQSSIARRRVLFVRNSHYQKAYQKSSRCTSGRCKGGRWLLIPLSPRTNHRDTEDTER